MFVANRVHAGNALPEGGRGGAEPGGRRVSRQPYSWLGVGAVSVGVGAAMAGLWGGTAVAHADSDPAAPAGVGQSQARAPHAAASASRRDRPDRAGVRQARVRTSAVVDTADAPTPAAASVAARSAVVRGVTPARARATVAAATAQPAGSTGCSSAGDVCQPPAATRVQALAYGLLTPLGLNASTPPKLLRGGLLWGVTRTAASLTGLVPATGAAILSTFDPKFGIVTGVISLEEEGRRGPLAKASGLLFPTTYYISDAPEFGTLVVDQTTGAWRYAADIGLPPCGCGDVFTITARNGVASTDYRGSAPVSATASIGSLEVGVNPQGIAVVTGSGNSNAGYVYVANEGSNSVSVISPGGGAVATTVNGLDAPIGVAVSSGNGDVWVANSGGGASVSRITSTLADSEITADLSATYFVYGVTGGSAQWVAAEPYLPGTREYVWFNYTGDTEGVTDSSLANYYPIDGSDAYFSRTLTAPNTGLAADPVNGNIWGFLKDGEQGFVLIPGSTSSIPGYSTYTINEEYNGSAQIALPPANSSGVSTGNFAYISLADANEVLVFDMTTKNSDGDLTPSYSATVTAGVSNPQGLAFGSDGDYVYVANNGGGGSGNVLIIETSTNTVVSTYSLPSGSNPVAVTTYSGDDLVYVSSYSNSSTANGYVYSFSQY